MTFERPGPADTAVETGDGVVKVMTRSHALYFLRLVWRGKPIILGCLLLALVPTILILQQVTPRYTAEVVLVIEGPDTPTSLLDHAARPFLNEATIQTETAVLSSSGLARRAMDKLALWDDPEFNAALRQPRLMDTIAAAINPVALLGRMTRPAKSEDLSAAAREAMQRDGIVATFSGRLSVMAQRRSYVITVNFTSEEREKAALIANTIADLYVLDRLESGFEETRRVTGWLGQRLDKLRKDVATAEQAVEVQRAAFGLRRKEDRAMTVTDQQMTEINSRLVLARADLAQKQARLGQVRALLHSRGSSDTAHDVLQSPLIQRLREQEATQQRQFSEASKTYGDRHPQIIGLRADLDELHRKLAQEIERIAISVENEVAVAVAGAKTLEDQMQQLRRIGDVASGEQSRLRELERDAEVSRTLYDSFLGRFKRDTEQERIMRANARVVSPAIIPRAASWPRKTQALFISIGGALLFGVGLVFLFDSLNNALRSADEVEDLTGLATLAMVPLVGRSRGPAPEEEVLKRPHSALADSLRGLRNMLDAPADGVSARVTLITSSLPQEGKSFVSLGLARMAAKGGRRVLLVDADLHRPRQHSMQNVAGGRGLVQVLTGEATLEEVLVHDERSGMDLLPSGELPAHTAEILSSPRMAALVAQLAASWDRIIIDSPPTLVVSDTRLLVRLADQVVYLIKWNSTSRDAVRNGIKTLGESGAKFAGVVLSQVDTRRHSRYYYGDYGQYYGRYRGYYSD